MILGRCGARGSARPGEGRSRRGRGLPMEEVREGSGTPARRGSSIERAADAGRVRAARGPACRAGTGPPARGRRGSGATRRHGRRRSSADRPAWPPREAYRWGCARGGPWAFPCRARGHGAGPRGSLIGTGPRGVAPGGRTGRRGRRRRPGRRDAGAGSVRGCAPGACRSAEGPGRLRPGIAGRAARHPPGACPTGGPGSTSRAAWPGGGHPRRQPPDGEGRRDALVGPAAPGGGCTGPRPSGGRPGRARRAGGRLPGRPVAPWARRSEPVAPSTPPQGPLPAIGEHPSRTPTPADRDTNAPERGPRRARRPRRWTRDAVPGRALRGKAARGPNGSHGVVVPGRVPEGGSGHSAGALAPCRPRWTRPHLPIASSTGARVSP